MKYIGCTMKGRYRHIVPRDFQKHQEMRKWCDENIKDRLINWDFTYYKSNYRFIFRFKKHYTWFLLRWS